MLASIQVDRGDSAVWRLEKWESLRPPKPAGPLRHVAHLGAFGVRLERDPTVATLRRDVQDPCLGVDRRAAHDVDAAIGAWRLKRSLCAVRRVDARHWGVER